MAIRTKWLSEALTRLSPAIQAVETPAFLIDRQTIANKAQYILSIAKEAGFEVLYALKSMTHSHVMQTMIAEGLNGFSASSLFEAHFAKEITGQRGTTHIHSPGLRQDEMEEIGKLCDFVSFNSLSQYHSLRHKLPGKMQKGLRVNPMLSFVEEERYNPCRKDSKLGIPIHDPVFSSPLHEISGIHFHSNCDCASFAPLLQTVDEVCEKLHSFMKNLEWINLGGGYLYDEEADYSPLFAAISRLNSTYKLKVFVEPGSALVNRAGFIVASVVDVFTHNGVSFAVLNTTVNHMPEIYEYGIRAEIFEDTPSGKYPMLLVGNSCLAGDVFGEYRFDTPLTIGSRVLFLKCGAYSAVKSHMFNGINLPNQYIIASNGEWKLTKQYTYADYRARCGA